MQRLFTIFPSGAPGIALLLLRFSVAAALISPISDLWSSPSHFFLMALEILLVFSLGCGFLTPYAAAVCAILDLRAAWSAPGEIQFFLWLACLNAVILALLGPGGYSLDSRIFGRRLLHIPPRRRA